MANVEEERFEEDVFNENENEEHDSADEKDDVDPEFLEYLQTSFQDEVVENIFTNIIEYIKTTAVPICEFLTKDDVEVIIQEFMV